jgi:hypothetical protein
MENQNKIIFFLKCRSGIELRSREKSIASSLKLDTDQFNLKSGQRIWLEYFLVLDGCETSLRETLICFENFHKASGLKINTSKTRI